MMHRCLTGSNMLLANAAIDALESWLQHLPRTALAPHYAGILAGIDPYLASSTLLDAADVTDELPDDTDAARIMRGIIKKSWGSRAAAVCMQCCLDV